MIKQIELFLKKLKIREYLIIVFLLLLSSCTEHKHHEDHDHNTIQLKIIHDGKNALIQHRIPGSVLPGFEKPIRNIEDEKIWKESIANFEINISKYIQTIPKSSCKHTIENWNRHEVGHHLDTVVSIEMMCVEKIEGFLFDYSDLDGIKNIELLFPEDPNLNRKYQQNTIEWKN